MTIHVQCYAGHRGDEEPRSFDLGELRIEVAQVMDRWVSPGARYFEVRAGDGKVYVLRHDETAGERELDSAPRRVARAALAPELFRAAVIPIPLELGTSGDLTRRKAMPYKDVKDLPQAQVDQYDPHQKEAFLKAFNNAYQEYGHDESRAFAVAHHAAKQAARKPGTNQGGR